MMHKKQVKCHQCHKSLNKDNAIVYRYISSSGKTKSNYYFHQDCYQIFIHNKEERDQMNKLWNYIRIEIFKWDEGKTCPPHLINRLQGLKSGQQNNYRAKGNKVFGNESGYSYDVILITFKLCKPMIINGIADSNKFKNIQHLIDYMLVIITNNINDVYFRMIAKVKSDKKVEKIKITHNEEAKFISKNEIDKNKVANKLKNIF
jgi:hypothetical protein